MTIDGNDLVAVYEATRAAVERAASGLGPSLIEALTYRWRGHSKSDRNLYRTKEEIEDWKHNRDPIMRFSKYLLQAEVLDEAQAQEIDAQAEQVILRAVEFAEASPEPDVSTLMEYVYA